MRIGEEVARAQSVNGFTDRQLGNAAGVAPSTVRRIKAGDGSVQVDTLCSVAEAVGLDLALKAYIGRQPRLRDTGQLLVAEYLAARRNLSGVVLMVDSRLGFTDLDRQLLSFVAPRVANGSVKLLALLTKADKLSRKESREALAAAQAVLGECATEEADLSLTLFSALDRTGVADAAVLLYGWAHPGS